MDLMLLPNLLIDRIRIGKFRRPLSENELQSSVLEDVIKWLRILKGARAERFAQGKKRDPLFFEEKKKELSRCFNGTIPNSTIPTCPLWVCCRSPG